MPAQRRSTRHSRDAWSGSGARPRPAPRAASTRRAAAVALAALGSDFRGLTWEMEAEGHHIEWDFVGVERHAVGTFAKCKVLVVEVLDK